MIKLYKDYCKINNIKPLAGNDTTKALNLANAIQGRVCDIYEKKLECDDFQDFIAGRVDFVLYTKDGSKIMELDGEVNCENERLAQLQAYFLENEIENIKA
jgi:hypothetical protein